MTFTTPEDFIAWVRKTAAELGHSHECPVCHAHWNCRESPCLVRLKRICQKCREQELANKA